MTRPYNTKASLSCHALCLALFICSLLPTNLRAGVCSFDGEIRERFEYFDGLNKKAYGDKPINAKGKQTGKSDDRILLQRLIAGLRYKPNKKIIYSLHLYDARVWGWSLDKNDFIKNSRTSDQYMMDPNEEYFEIHDAYIRASDLFTVGLSVKIGRQVIWYGDKRIFGPGSWGNSIGWLWDAAKVSYRKGDNFIDAWYGQTRTKPLA